MGNTTTRQECTTLCCDSREEGKTKTARLIDEALETLQNTDVEDHYSAETETGIAAHSTPHEFRKLEEPLILHEPLTESDKKLDEGCEYYVAHSRADEPAKLEESCIPRKLLSEGGKEASTEGDKEPCPDEAREDQNTEPSVQTQELVHRKTCEEGIHGAPVLLQKVHPPLIISAQEAPRGAVQQLDALRPQQSKPQHSSRAIEYEQHIIISKDVRIHVRCSSVDIAKLRERIRILGHAAISNEQQVRAAYEYQLNAAMCIRRMSAMGTMVSRYCLHTMVSPYCLDTVIVHLNVYSILNQYFVRWRVTMVKE